MSCYIVPIVGKDKLEVQKRTRNFLENAPGWGMFFSRNCFPLALRIKLIFHTNLLLGSVQLQESKRHSEKWNCMSPFYLEALRSSFLIIFVNHCMTWGNPSSSRQIILDHSVPILHEIWERLLKDKLDVKEVTTGSGASWKKFQLPPSTCKMIKNCILGLDYFCILITQWIRPNSHNLIQLLQ